MQRAVGWLRLVAVAVALALAPAAAVAAGSIATPAAPAFDATGYAYDDVVHRHDGRTHFASQAVAQRDLVAASTRPEPAAVGLSTESSGELLAPEGLSLPLHRSGSLSGAEVRAFYLEGERGIAALADDLAARGGPARQRALELIQTRNALRTQARNLMADRDAAAYLDAYYPNRSLSDLVGHVYRDKGLTGDAMWNYLAGSASRSNPVVNQMFGLQP